MASDNLEIPKDIIIKILRARIIEEKNRDPGTDSVNVYTKGYIHGLECALLFLGETEATEEHNKIINEAVKAYDPSSTP